MNRDHLQTIAKKYSLDYRDILSPQKGYRNYSYPIRLANGATVNLIVYKSEPDILERILRANNVADHAAQKGIPTRTTCSPRILQIKAGRHTKYAALYHYLPGSTIPWEAYTREHLKALGGAMGNLHAALQDFDTRNLPHAAHECQELHHRMQRYFADPGVTRALRVKLGLRVGQFDFTKMFMLCQKLPNQQALHMDFVRGNVLFSGKTISGILDFEKTAQGHALFDIARTLAFLLVDCKYKPEAKIRKYFLVSGYQKRGKAVFWRAKNSHFDILEELVKFFLMHDLYKFLLHNPYESLASNEHFTRTQALLLKYGLVSRFGDTML